jgi:hypothetical protein
VQSTSDVNVGTIEMSNPVRLAPTGAALPPLSARPFTGFLSLLHGLLDPRVTATGETLGRIGAKPVTKAANTNSTLIQDRQQTDKQQTNQQPWTGNAAAIHEASFPSTILRTAPEQVLAQTGDRANAAVQGGGPAITARAGIPASTAPTQTQTSAVPSSLAPSFPPTSVPPEHLTPIRAPLGPPRDLVFALRLTRQPAPSVTEAAAYSESETIPPETSNEAAASIAPFQAKEPPLATKTSATTMSEPTCGEAAESSRLSSSPTASQPFTAPDSVLQSRAELDTRNPVGTLQKASVSPSLQNRGATVYNPSTSGFSTILSPAETPNNPTEIEPQETDTPSALIPVKTAPESRDLESGLPAAGGDVQAETQPHIPDQGARLNTSDTAQYPAGATSPNGGTSRREPATGHLEVTQRRNAEQNASNEAGNSESAEKIRGDKSSRLPLTEKLTPPQNNHDRPSLSADGTLLGRSSEPGGALDQRAKAEAPSPAPALARENEAAAALAPPPLREVSLRLSIASPTAAAASVDVQFAERAGTVQVAVRTSDQDLAKSLQGNLGDLVGRLEEKGFKTDAWTPAAAQHLGTPLRGPSTSAESQNHSDHSGSQGGHPDSHGQQESNPRRQGRWQAELERTRFEEMLSLPNPGQGAIG